MIIPASHLTGAKTWSYQPVAWVARASQI